jgi:hypothetical protein
MSEEALDWTRGPTTLREAIEQRVRRLAPGAKVVEVRALRSDVLVSDSTFKAAGYGEPLLVVTKSRGGSERRFVVHFFRADEYGHDRRSDRYAAAMLAADSFGVVPNHVPALEVGVVGRDGHFVPTVRSGEPYLITEWADGVLYAEELRAVAERGVAEERDRERVQKMAAYLDALHVRLELRPAVYARAVRDLVGHGEGVFGILDGYPSDVPGAPPERLHAIERSICEWRWKLRSKSDRLCRTHGDFHPFNVLFSARGEVVVLDTSRGSMGDPADDVAAMAANFLFFAVDQPDAWVRGLGVLWRDWFDGYLSRKRDAGLLDVIAPFLAWRLLVLASPRWYPRLSAVGRDTLLRLAEESLAEPHFDPVFAEELMR